jgi:hypothetical protein
MREETGERRAYIEAVSRMVVADVAADELEFFDELVVEYYEDPNPPRSADAALGSGFGEALVAITPAAMAMATAVLSHIATELAEVLKEEATASLSAGLRRLFHPEAKTETPAEGPEQRPGEGPDEAPEQALEEGSEPAPDEGPTPLTKEQLEEIRRIARREARRFGVDPTTATNMAYALVGALAIA